MRVARADRFELAPVQDRRLDVDLPEERVQLATVLELVLHDVQERVAERRREVLVPPGRVLGHREGAVQVLVLELGEELLDAVVDHLPVRPQVFDRLGLGQVVEIERLAVDG